MPTETFLRLPQKKKETILQAAKNEFSRVSYREASINKIIEDAGISRGSFYKYFSDKKDLLFFLLRKYTEEGMKHFRQKLNETGGDIFSLPLLFFDNTMAFVHNSQEERLFRNVFMSMHSGDFHPREDINMRELMYGMIEKTDIKTIFSMVDKNSLAIETVQDLEELFFILNALTKHAIAKAFFNSRDRDLIRHQLVRAIDMIKNGVLEK